MYVTVLDEKASPSGKRQWLNTDTFGSTTTIDKKKLDKAEKEV
jgi:hypothetical protein